MSGRARRATRPTPCLFGATLGLRADCSRLTRACRHRAWAALPFGSLVLASGKPRSWAGVPRVSRRLGQGIASYEGKAAPTRATLQRGSGRFECSQRAGAEKSLDPRSSETIFPLFNFRDFAKSRFSKIENFEIFSIKVSASFLPFSTASTKQTSVSSDFLRPTLNPLRCWVLSLGASN